jgi:integrase
VAVRYREWGGPDGKSKSVWVADWSDFDGKRRTKSFPRKKEAQSFYDRVTAEVRAGVRPQPQTQKSPTVTEAGELWIKSRKAAGLEPTTLAGYAQHLVLHIEPQIGDVHVGDLTVPMVRAMEDKLREQGRSPAMIKKVLSSLGSLLTDAEERGLVTRNVARSLRSTRRRTTSDARARRSLKIGVDIPSPAEIRKLLPYLPARWKPFFLVAIFTGLRASELRGLRWADVDLRKQVIHVAQRADRHGTMGGPKSAAGERSIPIPPMVVQALREWKLACPKGELDLAFPNGAGSSESHANIVQRVLRPAMVAAGLVTKSGAPKYTGLHAFRHFYASWCINRKVDGGLELPLKVIQTRLGHASIQMTADTYGHLFPRGDDGSELEAAEKAFLRD